MVIVEAHAVQITRVYVIRVYATYHEVVNENHPEDHGEEDNMEAFVWAQDAYAFNSETAMPERSSNPEFHACWTVGAYQTSVDGQQAEQSVLDWIYQNVPAHIRAYHVVTEHHDMVMGPPEIHEVPHDQAVTDWIQQNIPQDNTQDMQDMQQIHEVPQDMQEIQEVYPDMQQIQEVHQANIQENNAFAPDDYWYNLPYHDQDDAQDQEDQQDLEDLGRFFEPELEPEHYEPSETFETSETIGTIPQVNALS